MASDFEKKTGPSSWGTNQYKQVHSHLEQNQSMLLVWMAKNQSELIVRTNDGQC